MTRLTWVEGSVMLAFWIAGLVAFLIGGLSLVGHMVQALLALVFWWVARELYREYHVCLREEYDRHQVFKEWDRQQRSRLKGME